MYKRIFSVTVTTIAISLILSTLAYANDVVSSFNGWQTVGPAGGDAREVVIDPKDRNHLYLSTVDGQIYTSSNAGQSWRLLVNFNRPLLVLDQLIVDPRDSNVIYTSGHRGKMPGGFFKSKDGGATWKESPELKNEAIHAMVQSEKNLDLLLAGSVGGIWISYNAGETWARLDDKSAPKDIDSLAVDPTDTNIMYAGTWWRPYKSTDGGKTWRLIKNGMIDDSDVFAIDIDPRNADNVFASACSGIYYSTNKGEKWAKVQGIPSDSRRTRAIMQHPTVAGTVYAGTTEGFWMSSDNGKSWSLTTLRQLEVNSIAVHPTEPNKVYIATNNYGLMVSEDRGKSFSINNGNLSTRFTNNIVTDIERPNRLYATTINTATGGGFIFVSDDSGVTWQPVVKNIVVNRLAPYSLLQDRKNADTIYLATNIGLYRSVDRGVSWAAITKPASPAATVKKPAPKGKKTTAAKPKPATTAVVPSVGPAKVIAFTERVNFLAHTEDGKDGMFAATNKGLYRTYDIKNGWEKVNFGDGIDQQVFVVKTSPVAPDTIWAGTATSGVIVSKDNGATWQKVNGIQEGIPVSSIEIDPQNPDKIYVGTIRTFYLSRDGGTTWVRRGGNLPLGNYTKILVNPKNSNELFVCSSFENDGGVYQSLDGGTTWKRLDTVAASVASRRVWTMAFDPTDSNRIFAGTHSAGIYRIERPASATAPATLEPGTRPRVAGGNKN